MSILNNAVLSIRAGLEDFQQATPARLLSCIRNLHAGVLLLLKTRLLELSPAGSDEVLLKQKIKPTLGPAGGLAFIGTGKKTVEVDEIRQRLSSLGVVVDWERIERLTRERNNIEHYYPQVSNDAMRGLVANVFLIVRDFTVRELQRDPRELLGDAAWEQLLKNEEVFTVERAQCADELRRVKWTSSALAAALETYVCPDCASPLMRPRDVAAAASEIVLTCRSCGRLQDVEEFAEDALESHFAYEVFEAAKGSGDSPLGTCPSCMKETFVVEEDACAVCGYEREHSTCLRCGASLDVEEQELGGLCGYCYHVMDSRD